MFQIVIVPITIPAAPTPIANNKKFFRSAMIMMWFVNLVSIMFQVMLLLDVLFV